MSLLEKRNSYFFYILLGIIGGIFLFSASDGAEYLVGNQTTYFLYGLKLFDSTFIPLDWYTWNVFHYHFAFGYLLYFLQFIGPLYITIAAVQLLTMIALSFGVLILSKRFCRNPVPVYFALITWLGVHHSFEIGLGWQVLIAGYSQPSEIAGSLMILGLALLLNYQYLLSGLILGIAGLFHAAILASFAPIIFATAFAVNLWKNSKSLIFFGLPLVFFWGIFALVLGNVLLNSSSDSLAMSIIVNLRNSGDLIISNWSIKWTFIWLIYAVMGFIALWALPKEKKFRELRISFFASFLFVCLTVVQVALFKIDSITALMLWRAAPWIIILSLLIVLDRCIDLLIIQHKNLRKSDKYFIIFAVITGFVLFISGWGSLENKGRFIWIISFPLVILTSYLFTKLKISSINRLYLFVFFLSIILIRSPINNIRNFISPPLLNQSSEIKMEEWIRENTPADAIFIIPLDIEKMRVQGRRAVIVEWKSTTSIPSDLREWYRRILDVSGFPYKTSPDEISRKLLVDGYNNLDTIRANYLKKLYGARYIVVSNDHKGDLDELAIKYQNAEYRVLEISR